MRDAVRYDFVLEPAEQQRPARVERCMQLVAGEGNEVGHGVDGALFDFLVRIQRFELLQRGRKHVLHARLVCNLTWVMVAA